MEIIIQSVIAALLFCFTFKVYQKFGIKDYIEANVENKIIRKLLTCEFCMTFWGMAIMTTVIYLSGCYIDILITPITAYLVTILYR